MASTRETRRHRTLSVRWRIVVSILMVTALGLAASGVASYLVQREQVLTIIDDQLLRTVPELKTIAAGDTSAAPLTSVGAVLRAAMQQIIPASNESVLGFIDGMPALVPAANLPFRISLKHNQTEIKIPSTADRWIQAKGAPINKHV